MKTEVMDFYRPDVVGLVETWSKGGGGDCCGRL